MAGKVAIVTGASRGIGAAVAARLAAEGYALCVNYAQSKAEAEALAKRLPRAIAVRADMGREGDILRLFETVDKELGPVTALVNNAGISGERMALEEMRWEQWERLFAVNVFGVFLACREAMVRMKKAGGGAIVTIGSEAGRFGGTRLSGYAASKAAVHTLTQALAREAAAHGVRVNALSPAIIATQMTEDVSVELLRGLPMGRAGTPEEVAEAVAWLLSEKASYISGAVLPVTGAR